jgi:hypothetical protein
MFQTTNQIPMILPYESSPSATSAATLPAISDFAGSPRCAGAQHCVGAAPAAQGWPWRDGHIPVDERWVRHLRCVKLMAPKWLVQVLTSMSRNWVSWELSKDFIDTIWCNAVGDRFFSGQFTWKPECSSRWNRLWQTEVPTWLTWPATLSREPLWEKTSVTPGQKGQNMLRTN